MRFLRLCARLWKHLIQFYEEKAVPARLMRFCSAQTHPITRASPSAMYTFPSFMIGAALLYHLFTWPVPQALIIGRKGQRPTW